jgi:hypothetical protein
MINDFPSKSLTERIYETRLPEEEIEELCRSGQIVSSLVPPHSLEKTEEIKGLLKEVVSNRFLSMISMIMRQKKEETQIYPVSYKNQINEEILNELETTIPIKKDYQKEVYSKLLEEFNQKLEKNNYFIPLKWGNVTSTINGIVLVMR